MVCQSRLAFILLSQSRLGMAVGGVVCGAVRVPATLLPAGAAHPCLVSLFNPAA
jgi:hypothetical protein